MQLPQEPEIFSQYFFEFLKPTSNFEYFEKREESYSLNVSEILDSEKSGYLNI